MQTLIAINSVSSFMARRANGFLALAASVLCVTAVAKADYAVTREGAWPKDWPAEMEGLRKQAQTYVGPLRPQHHHGISFNSRKEFEAAWPHILKVMSKGAPIVLKKPKSFWLGEAKAGLCIHTPPAGQEAVAWEDADGRWDKSIYIELIVDGTIVDLNRIQLPEGTPIIDKRFKTK